MEHDDFRHEDMTKYARLEQGFRLGAMLTSEIYSGSEADKRMERTGQGI